MATRKGSNGTFRWLESKKLWEYRVRYEPLEPGGVQERKSFYGKKQKICRDKAREYESKVIGEKEECITLEVWLSRWLEIYKKPKVIEGTYLKYIHQSNIILAHPISNMQLDRIKPMNVAEFYEWTKSANNGKPYSKTTIEGVRTLLRSSYEDAVENELCFKNPASRVSLPKFNKSKPKRAYSDDEVNIITEFAKTDTSFGAAVLLLIWTGLRSGELRALTWQDIDLENSIVHISKAVKSDDEIGCTKNEESRSVPIKKEISEYITNLKHKHKYVVYSAYHSGFVRKETVRHKLKAFFVRLNNYRRGNNLPEITMYTPHELRHTYTTWYMRRGASVELLQLLTGHKDKDMTLHYTHYNTEDLRKIVDLTE